MPAGSLFATSLSTGDVSTKACAKWCTPGYLFYWFGLLEPRGVFNQLAPYLATKRIIISGIWWERLKQYRLLAPQIQLNTWMPPDQTATFYNGAKIVINMHRAYDDQSYNYNSRRISGASPNPRTFEISGCGAFQLTDIRDDLVNFYTPDYDIVTYASLEEMLQQNELLFNP